MLTPPHGPRRAHSSEENVDHSTDRLAEEIARREEVEQQLLASEAKYRDLYDHAPDMFVSVCPKTRLVLNCNRTLIKVIGRSEEQIVGHDLMELYHPDCHEGVTAAFNTFVKYGDVPETELLLLRTDGSRVEVSLRVTAVRDSDGNILYSRSAWRDITQRKHMERMLAERQSELFHVARLNTMGEMASGLAHELNQPLQAITNFADGCVARLEAGVEIDHAVLVGIAKEVSSQALRAGEIIRRLRRMVARREPIRETVDVHTLVSESLRLVDVELRHEQIQVKHTAIEECPVSVDSVQIEQVLVNLIRNSIEALKVNGPDDRLIIIDVRRTDSATLVTVRDNGPGVSAKMLPRLFEGFQTSSETGLGLGLAISRTIVESHGGEISAENGSSGGANFQFSLPRE